MVTCVTRRFDADALLQTFFAQISAPGPSGHHQMDGVTFGAHAKLLVTNPHQWTDVAALQFVSAHDIALHIHDFLFTKRNMHAQNLRAVEQALGMFFQSKDCCTVGCVVSAHALKSAATVMQSVCEDVDLGVAPLDHFSVHPDFAVTV